MLLYILLAFFIVMLVICYVKLEKDIIQPAVIFCAVYILSIVCVIMNIDNWNIIFHSNTFFVLALGGLEFVAICFIIHKIYQKKQKSDETTEKSLNENEKNIEENPIRIQKLMVILVCLYDVVVLGLLIYNVLHIASQFGEYSNFTEALRLFKYNTSYNINAQIPHYMNLLGKPVIIFAYIFLYIYLRIIIQESGKMHKKIFKYLYYLIPVFTYIFYEFTASNRLTILSLCIGAVAMAVILWNQKHNWNKIIKIKTIGKMLIGAICGLILFYYSAALIGRVNSKGIVDYITLYCGGSIECLNRFMQDPPEKSNIIGKETFYYFIRNLDDYGILKLDEKYPIHLEFRYSRDNMIGNVYTAYRRWIYDFGIPGMIFLQAIMAAFYQIFYEKIKENSRKGKDVDLLTILYGYMAYPLFLHPIDGYLYLLTIRLAFITTLIMYLLAYIVLIKTKIEDKKIKIKIGNKNIELNLKRKREKKNNNEKE